LEVLPDGQERREARLIYLRKRDLIDAHLTIVCATLPINHWIERQTG
jgi:hypothetical protein